MDAHCDGVPTGALRSERQYENFILELEWRHLNRGQLRRLHLGGSMPALGQPFLRAIEVRCLRTHLATPTHTPRTAMSFRFTDRP
jgi:hypothetical protein